MVQFHLSSWLNEVSWVQWLHWVNENNREKSALGNACYLSKHIVTPSRKEFFKIKFTQGLCFAVPTSHKGSRCDFLL